jgi:hypothetical protein
MAKLPPHLLLELPGPTLTWVDELENGRLRIYTPLTNGFGTFSLPITAPGPGSR